VKFLFDQNLSHKLADAFQLDFPGSTHILRINLSRVLDETVWEYARVHGFTIVTKDSDYLEIALLRGHPPKVIWIRRGNCTTPEIESLLRRDFELIVSFLEDAALAVLALA
jgi:predicted nuclease of predicted toxin-antitoxin system